MKKVEKYKKMVWHCSAVFRIDVFAGRIETAKKMQQEGMHAELVKKVTGVDI